MKSSRPTLAPRLLPWLCLACLLAGPALALARGAGREGKRVPAAARAHLARAAAPRSLPDAPGPLAAPAPGADAPRAAVTQTPTDAPAPPSHPPRPAPVRAASARAPPP